MAAIGLYLLKAFPYNTSVRHTIPVHFYHQIMCHFRRCFIPFFSGDRKQYTATTAEHSKHNIELFQNITVLFADMSTIWGNTDGCAEQYRCATALYLLSMLAHAYNTITDRGGGSPGHGIEPVDGFNAN